MTYSRPEPARDLTAGRVACVAGRDVWHLPERVGACEACVESRIHGGAAAEKAEPVVRSGLGTQAGNATAFETRRASRANAGERPAPSTPSRPRAGEASEAALYAALEDAGYIDLIGRERILLTGEDDALVFVRQLPWGAYLSPPRRFCADAGFPEARLLVEVEGDAHAVKRQRKGDVLRRQLAESAGWRVLSVLPEQVKTGEAVALVREALERRA